MTEGGLQFVVTLVPKSRTSFTVMVGLEEIGVVKQSGLTIDFGKWVWSELPYNVSGSLLAGERGPGLFENRMEAVWALLAARFKSEPMV